MPTIANTDPRSSDASLDSYLTIPPKEWFAQPEIALLFIEPGSPWGNDDVESFTVKFQDELLNGELFSTLREAQVVIERWRRASNQVWPARALGYRPSGAQHHRPAAGACSTH